MDGVSVMPLDVTDPSAGEETGGEIGGKTDILINTARHVRPGGVLGGHGVRARRMEVNALGLMRLAQAFGPAWRRAPLMALTAPLPSSTSCRCMRCPPIRSMARFRRARRPRCSISQTLRAEFAASGLRVINVYTGPTDDEWHQPLPPPKVAPKALAAAIVEALCEGLEDVYCGDVAKDLAERWRRDPKVLEREMAGGGA
jgi:NAD(P)-dependent dehydrogenase (short-subunit alcohol dehydrogenase family)